MFWQGVLNVNKSQKNRLADLIINHESDKPTLNSSKVEQKKRKIAVFGFSYKKNTSDTRSTPAATIVGKLAQSGFSVSIHDPQVTRAGFEMEMIAQGYENLI